MSSKFVDFEGLNPQSSRTRKPARSFLPSFSRFRSEWPGPGSTCNDVGLAGNASAADLQRAVEQRSILNDDHFAGTLRACESARYDTNLEPAQALQLIQELHDYTSRLKLFPTPRAEKEKA